MIDKRSFTLEWIESFKKKSEYRHIQTNILEKMIYSLYLVELLKNKGLNFVFKGGTSLVLLIEEDNRFSIDVDIICNQKRNVLEKTFEEIVEDSIFVSFALDEKRSYKPGIPKAHYIFEYVSKVNPKFKSSILLDILDEEVLYPEVINRPVSTRWISNKGLSLISLPSVDSITGDKLTAFAPNTIGIPYYKGKNSFGMEICKQLFDLSRLFIKITDIKVVADSFYRFAKREIQYRRILDNSFDILPQAALLDTISTCVIISKRDANKIEPDKSNFRLIQDGIKSLNSGYLMSGNFRLDDAINASAKIAYLASKVLSDDLSDLGFYEKDDVSELIIQDPKWNFLNKLKKLQDKSTFFYWYHAYKILVEMDYEFFKQIERKK
ncbi:MAG: nucleotidyl transferase AbiEii/AbiGii toxin family protein [Candidatus Delongbacteria bacterium]|nr:nucleotidyl transferase AbiEii/AbiGii toxin family protein [Candidatus Delongbacteria bacterium]